MPAQPDPIPLKNLIRDGGELAVWYSAFGAAFAAVALRHEHKVRFDDPELCDLDCTIATLKFSSGAVTFEAQLIAQAAVLQYRRIAS